VFPGSDPKLLPKIEATVEAAQTASAYLCLVKFCLLMVGAAGAVAWLAGRPASTANRRRQEPWLCCRCAAPHVDHSQWWRCLAVTWLVLRSMACAAGPFQRIAAAVLSVTKCLPSGHLPSHCDLRQAADLSMKKGRGPPWAEAGRMAEIDTAGRERGEVRGRAGLLGWRDGWPFVWVGPAALVVATSA